MSKIFDLAGLMPEPLTVTDVDGTRYDMKTADMLSATEYAQMQRLKRDGERLERESSGDDEAAAAWLDEQVNQLFRMLLPGMPEERQQAIPFAHKYRVLNWWNTQQAKPEGQSAGEARASRTTQSKRRRRSP